MYENGRNQKNITEEIISFYYNFNGCCLGKKRISSIFT
jgi:hypothetical protein